MDGLPTSLPFLVDFIFTAREAVKSLPPFHGGRYHAWLRFALKAAAIPLEETVSGILPLGKGQKAILPGNAFGFRIFLDKPECLPEIVWALQKYEHEEGFSGKNAKFAEMRDAVTGTRILPGGAGPARLSIERIKKEVQGLQNRDKFSLDFFTPLRLPLPPGQKDRTSWIGRFCGNNFFRNPDALGWLLGHVRFMVPEAPDMSGMNIAASDLKWEDMRYSRSRKIALGGLVGRLTCEGVPDPETALRLCLGQYLGAGKNSRFGLGWWRVPELDAIREIELPE